MAESQESRLDELTAGVHASIPILAAMGLRVVDASRGRAATEIPLAPNANHVGIAYAGALFSVAEMLGGVLAQNTFDLPGFVPLVKSMEIVFSRPAASDVRASTSLSKEEVARVGEEAPRRGKSDFVLEAEVTDAAGVVVARTRGTYQVRRMG